MAKKRTAPRRAARGLHHGAAPLHEEPGDLDIDPAEIVQAAVELAQRRLELGVPLTPAETAEDEPSVTVVVDPDSRIVAATLRSAHARAPGVIAESGVTPAALDECGAQQDEMLVLYQRAARGEACVEDSRCIVAAVEREVQDQMRTAITQLLREGAFAEDERRELLVMIGAADREDQQLIDARQRRARRTRAQKAAQRRAKPQV